MWMVTVATKEDQHAWETCLREGIICMGWPTQEGETERPQVKQFKKIEPGDWVVAHVPSSHGGEPCLARGLGRVAGNYEEVPGSELIAKGSEWWDWSVRRQYQVTWNHVRDVSLRGAVSHYIGTVRHLTEDEEREVLKRFRV